MVVKTLFPSHTMTRTQQKMRLSLSGLLIDIISSGWTGFEFLYFCRLQMERLDLVSIKSRLRANISHRLLRAAVE